jgi:hypothetical protein
MALAFALLLGGCGLTQTRGPNSHRPPAQRPDCTESFDAPKRDAFGAVGGFLTIVVGLLFYDVGDNEGVGVPLIIGGGVVMAGSYVSGGVGYYRVKSCRKAIAEFEQRSHNAQPPGVAPTP